MKYRFFFKNALKKFQYILLRSRKTFSQKWKLHDESAKTRAIIVDVPEVVGARGRVERRIGGNGGQKKGHGEVLEGPQKSKGQSLVKRPSKHPQGSIANHILTQ